MALTETQLKILKEARFYLTDIADCTCDREYDTSNCFYYLTGVQKAKEAVAYAVESVKRQEDAKLKEAQNYLDTPGRPIYIEEGLDGDTEERTNAGQENNQTQS